MTTLAEIDDSVEPLSARELEILGLVARGLANKQIANRLSLSERTIHEHVRRIYLKTGVARSRAALALLWVRLSEKADGAMPGDKIAAVQSGASVRLTVDLDIELYRLLTTWAQAAAVELGRPRLALTDCMRAMIRRTATDVHVTRLVIETLAPPAEGRPS
jgi:DNA-binding CsgD family transcriptional regulator